jgi:hypothetical protein
MQNNTTQPSTKHEGADWRAERVGDIAEHVQTKRKADGVPRGRSLISRGNTSRDTPDLEATNGHPAFRNSPNLFTR